MLSRECADFVLVIHTDAGGSGTLFICGHADFIPNGGHRVQPNCTETIAQAFGTSIKM